MRMVLVINKVFTVSSKNEPRADVRRDLTRTPQNLGI